MSMTEAQLINLRSRCLRACQRGYGMARVNNYAKALGGNGSETTPEELLALCDAALSGSTPKAKKAAPKKKAASKKASSRSKKKAAPKPKEEPKEAPAPAAEDASKEVPAESGDDASSKS